MALISCEDCGHQVSDLATTCPQCARPLEVVAERLGAGRTPKPSSRPPATGTELPRETIRWQNELRRARSSAAGEAKRCARCGQNVALDAFRMKSAAGYLCAECQDADFDLGLRARARVRKLVMAFAVLVTGVALLTTLLYVANNVSWGKATRTTK